MIVFSERLKELRKSAGLNQTELGEKLNCQRTRIADLERGKSTPSLEDIEILCREFDVSSDYLLGLSDVMTNDTDVKMICDYTGLTEEAVDNLHDLINVELYQTPFKSFSFDPASISVVNYLLSDIGFFCAARDIYQAYTALNGAYDISIKTKDLLRKTPNIKQAFYELMKDMNEFPNTIDDAIGKETCDEFRKNIDNIAETHLYLKYDLSDAAANDSVIDYALMRIDEMVERKKYEIYDATKEIERLFEEYLSGLLNAISTNHNDIIAYYQEGASSCPQ